MNTAYGPAEELPFDMGHLRYPIRYELPATATNAERRAVRKTLTENFEEILCLMIAERPKVAPSAAPAFQEASAPDRNQPAFFFVPIAPLAEFGRPGEQQYRFLDRPMRVYLRLFPKYEQPLVGRARLKQIVAQQYALYPMVGKMLPGLTASNHYGYITLDATTNNATQAISQAFVSGEIWGVNSQILQFGRLPHFSGPDEEISYFGVVGHERVYTRIGELCCYRS